MKQGFLRFIRDERGATAIEYGLIAGLVALAVAGGATMLGGKLEAAFERLADKVETMIAPAGSAAPTPSP